MKKEEKNWNSTTINQFELSKMVYTSGFLAKVNLTPTAKLVLIALMQHYNANNAEMFPSQKFLGAQLGISEKSVERAIANLRDENLIFYVTQQVNKYRFTAHFFEQIKMSVDHRQNVGSHHRQNVGQTNKDEQINKKEFLDFLGEGASGVAAQTLENFAFKENKVHSCNEANASQPAEKTENSNNLQENFEQKTLKHADFKKNCENFENFVQDFEKSAQLPLNGTFEAVAQGAENLKFLGNKGAMCENLANISSHKNAKNVLQQENQESSVLDWSREDALAWVLKLSPLFRVRGLAKMLTEKWNYSQEELGLSA